MEYIFLAVLMGMVIYGGYDTWVDMKSMCSGCIGLVKNTMRISWISLKSKIHDTVKQLHHPYYRFSLAHAVHHQRNHSSYRAAGNKYRY